MNYIYVVSTFTMCELYSDEIIDFGDIRSVCWCKSYKDAVETVLSNCCDIYEGIYTYAVIEKLAPIMYPTSENCYKRYFFKWDIESCNYKVTEEVENKIKKTHILPTFSIG